MPDTSAEKLPEIETNAAPTSSAALLLIDVINDLEFEGAEKLIRYIPEMTARLAALKQRAKKSHIPVIYVNDNYGDWKSDFRQLVRHCLEDDVRGKSLVASLQPDEDDYYVLKPKHSGFYSTSLDILLEHLAVRTLILTGLAGNICLLFTANDAYMRELSLFIPSDCCASNEASDNDYALAQMEQLLKADVRPSTELDLEQIGRSGK